MHDARTTRDSNTAASDAATSASPRTSMPRVVALATLAFGGGALTLAGAGAHSDREAPDAPALLASQIPCAERASDEASARASELESRAHAKMVRYPFAPEVGVATLDLLVEAAACRERAGDAAGASGIHAVRTRWLATLDADYRDHRLRLERARRTKRYADALFEAMTLSTLLTDRQGDYTAWLRRLIFELEALADGATRGVS